MDLEWGGGALLAVSLRSRGGNRAVAQCATDLTVTSQGRPVRMLRAEEGLIAFETKPGATYRLSAARSAHHE